MAAKQSNKDKDSNNSVVSELTIYNTSNSNPNPNPNNNNRTTCTTRSEHNNERNIHGQEQMSVSTLTASNAVISVIERNLAAVNVTVSMRELLSDRGLMKALYNREVHVEIRDLDYDNIENGGNINEEDDDDYYCRPQMGSISTDPSSAPSSDHEELPVAMPVLMSDGAQAQAQDEDILYSSNNNNISHSEMIVVQAVAVPWYNNYTPRRKLMILSLFGMFIAVILFGVGVIVSLGDQSSGGRDDNSDIGSIDIGINDKDEELTVIGNVYSVTEGEMWTNNTGWVELDNDLENSNVDVLCSCYGIICAAGKTHYSGKYISRVDLSDNNLIGGISDVLESLVFWHMEPVLTIEHIDLSSNYLEGDLTESSTYLQKFLYLKSLDLSNNEGLSGSIPKSLCNKNNLQIAVGCGISCSCCVPRDC